MLRLMVIFLVALASFASFDGRAMFGWYSTQEVPIGRLFTNLQERLARNTNDFEVTYDLARLHSMAYSTNLFSIGVRTNDSRPEFYGPGSDAGVPRSISLPPSPEERTVARRHLTNAILLFERAIVLLKTSTNKIEYKQWLVLPLELGHAWCLDQAGSRKEALAAYRKTLALAWKKEVTGEFKFQEWLEGTWNAVKAGNNPLRVATRRGHIGPGVCYSEEIIGYLLKLLDPAKDAAEIADLRDKQKTLTSTPRAVTPILVPLESNAAFKDLVDPYAAMTFDLDGSGLPRQWGWITPKAAWLVFDPDGRGKITSGLQMFGNVTFWIFWRDGYEALGSLDDNHDGVLSGDELRGMALWQDRNSNGICDPGEVRPVSDWGITAISCAGERHPTGISWSPKGVVFTNGESRPTYDWIVPSRPKWAD